MWWFAPTRPQALIITHNSRSGWSLHDEVHLSELSQSHQAVPDGLVSWFAIGFSTEKSAQLCNPANRLPDAGRLAARRGSGMNCSIERLPFFGLKQHAGGQIGRCAREHLCVQQAQSQH